MKTTVSEENHYPIPEDVLVPVELLECKQVTVDFVRKKDGTSSSFNKWEWTFRAISGEYAGTEVRGSTEPKVTSATESSFLPLARPFIEALLGRALQVGEEVDTDDLIGLPCQITVRHLDPRPRKNGEGHWFNVEINEVFPYSQTSTTSAAPAAGWGSTSYDEPPY